MDPQLTSVSPQRSARTVPFGQPHLTSVVMRQGGHGPGWQRSGQGCAQVGRTRVHGDAQECGVEIRAGAGDGVESQKQRYEVGTPTRRA
jgi:hypothetical protein